MTEGGPHSINNKSNEPHLETGLRVICTVRMRVGEADSPATWSHPDLSETFT